MTKQSIENKPINKTQIQIIHIAKAQLGLSDEAYRIVLNDLFWVNTCKDLSYEEATKLIDHFKSKGFRIITKRYEQRAKSREHRAGNIIQLVSKQQLAMIEHLRADIKWHVHDGYFRWLRKWLKKDHIATSRDANSVIEGLKGMLKRQQKTGQTGETSLRRDGGMYGGRWQW